MFTFCILLVILQLKGAIHMTDIRQTVINNLKTICKLRNIKNVQIAEYMGVSPGSVSNWFKGTNAIDIDNLYKLCQFLGISLDQVFGVSPLAPEIVLSDSEARLVSAYRSADDHAREYALWVLEKNQQKDTHQSAI